MAVGPRLTGHTELASSQVSTAHQANRGRYRIFLGMAAGAGKTYRMLQEGQAEAEPGHDLRIVADRTQRSKESNS